ncbi:hypothetical protein AWM75_05680 [Aerococcus urinaehominis]|uniref:Uncharacterized protein n=1 Tax=Aerococcus urinaehominis TaxID=128944 RepID=A0A0X8FMS1_9LACT|nr:MFS transporter [Aerococcus urinaehominis]AMB99517.1 hypothetical protein AWM75_05680 [Aerococcus urinaehominis]SDM25649.1 glycoside/pentoside/hexuronide:cation symporter, GPH family [Aerococcus urinaehominis]
MATNAKKEPTTVIFDERKRPFSGRDLIGYFFGDFGCNMSFTLISAYQFIFYTQYLGIKLTHYSALILVAKIIDAINDPIVGSIIDRLDPRGQKREKFKPWVLYFGPALALAATVMFIDSSAFSYGVRFTVGAVGYILWDLMYTCVNVPYGSLASVMTVESEQRSLLSTARAWESQIGNTLLTVLIPLIVYQTVNGESIFQGQRMFPIAIGLGVIATLSFFITYFNTEERLVHVPISEAKEINPDLDKVEVVEPTNEVVEGDKENNFFDVLKDFFKNRAVIGVSLASLAQVLFIQTAPQLFQLNYQIYYGDGSLNAWSALPQIVPLIIGATLGTFALRKWGTKAVSSWPVIGAFVAYFLYAIFPVSPEQPWIFIAVQTIANTFSFGMWVYVWGMVGDAIDYQEWQTGSRNEGSIYAIYSMARKIGQGIGQAAVPLILATFIPSLDLNNTATWTAENADALKSLSGWFPGLGWLLVFIALTFVYNLTPQLLERVNKDLGRTEVANNYDEIHFDD